MNTSITLISILFFVNISLSQSEIKKVSIEDSLRFENSLKKSKDSLNLLLSKMEYLNDEDKKISIEFVLDTFMIEKRFELYLNQDYSDFGMNKASINKLYHYEFLLNKYYKLLLNELKNEDKETLKITQRNWLKYRESETQLNDLISQQKYSGGGTIQNIFVLSRNIEITQSRVIEFHMYLERLMLNK